MNELIYKNIRRGLRKDLKIMNNGSFIMYWSLFFEYPIFLFEILGDSVDQKNAIASLHLHWSKKLRKNFFSNLFQRPSFQDQKFRRPQRFCGRFTKLISNPLWFCNYSKYWFSISYYYQTTFDHFRVNGYISYVFYIFNKKNNFRSSWPF